MGSLNTSPSPNAPAAQAGVHNMTITARDKELAAASWRIVEKDYAAVGLILFKELFTTYPDYIQFFEKLKTDPNQDIFESARFKRHMISALFPSLAEMLRNLDHPEALTIQLREIAVNHKKRGLTRQHFKNLQKTIMVTFRKALGDDFDKETEASWDKILSTAMNKISDFIENTEL